MPRKEDRVNYINEIVLEWSSGNREARITDLSTGGCYVDTIATIPEGELVSFVLNIRTGEALPLTGKVAYVLPGFGFGIEFLDVTEEAKSILERLVKEAA